MGSLPASYFQYYYFKDEVLAEMQALEAELSPFRQG